MPSTSIFVTINICGRQCCDRLEVFFALEPRILPTVHPRIDRQSSHITVTMHSLLPAQHTAKKNS